MSRRPLVSSLVTAGVLGLTVAGCGGNDGGDDAATTAPPAAQRPLGGDGKPPSTSGQLPPAFVKCMADQGFEVRSSAEVHSASQGALQACFGALHEGGG